MLELCLKILLAHILGDFIFQPNKWVKDKIEKKHKSPYLYWHILIHALLLILVLNFEWKYYIGFIAIISSHYIIDLLKLNLTGKANSRWLFFIDQCLHILVIIAVAYAYHPIKFSMTWLTSPKTLLLLIAVLLASKVSSIIMRVIITKWELVEDASESSLEDAGKYIGILERLFVFGFVITNHWQAIGFLLAAKSVFRFGDLSKSKDRKLTEYILIGTLISFGLAILIGQGYLYFLNQLIP